MRKFLFHWGPVVAWMGVIFLLSTRPSVKVSDAGALNFLFYKSLHLIEYGTLYFLTYRALRYSFPRYTVLHWWTMAFMITIFYGMTDEIHQTFVPTREGRGRDVIIDGAGATLAWILLVHILPRMPKKLRVLGKKLGLS